MLEIEPQAAAGIDLGYMRLVTPRDAVRAGIEALILPQTLFGVNAGYQHFFPLSKRISLTAGPMIQAFVLGGDLPDGTVILQGLLQVGFHGDL